MTLIAVTLVFGRVWCGWACPQTVVGEIIVILERGLGSFLPRRIAGQLVRISISALMSANIVWYFISPYEMLPRLFSWSLGPGATGVFVVLWVIFYLNFTLLGHRFCGTVCPYSKVQSMLLDKNSLVIAFDRDRADECKGCDLCVRECPVGLDIKDGLQVECINCAQCIDACTKMMKKRGKKPLVRYIFGEPAATLRDAVTFKALFFVLVCAGFAAALVYSGVDRQPYAVRVLREGGGLYRVTKDGSVSNLYRVVIYNRTGKEARFRLTLGGLEGGELNVPGGEPMVGPGERGEAIALVELPSDRLGGPKSRDITVTATETTNGRSMSGEASFITP